MFLGLDVSTSIIGVSLINKTGDVLLCDHIDLRKHKNLFDKAEVVREYFGLHRYTQAAVEEVWIEQPFTFFNSGGSSAKTMALLQSFNGIVSWLVYQAYGYYPEYIGARSARKINEVNIKRGENSKQKVLEFLLDTESSFSVEYTRHGNPKPGYYDRADSLIIAKAARELWKQKNLES